MTATFRTMRKDVLVLMDKTDRPMVLLAADGTKCYRSAKKFRSGQQKVTLKRNDKVYLAIPTDLQAVNDSLNLCAGTRQQLEDLTRKGRRVCMFMEQDKMLICELPGKPR
jgi:hypothetical protein